MKTITALLTMLLIVIGCYRGEPFPNNNTPISNPKPIQNMTLKITYPAQDDIITQITYIEATANNPLDGFIVKFFAGGKELTPLNQIPLKANLDTTQFANGLTLLRIEGYSEGKLLTTDEIQVNIQNAPITLNPELTLNGIKNGDTVTALTPITAKLLNITGNAEVQFKVNGMLKLTDNTAPYEFNLNPADFQNGNILLTAEAYQNGKLIAQQQINLIVKNNVIVPDPVLQLIGAANGDIIKTQTLITANLLNTKGTLEVQFKVNGALKLTDNTAPYEFNLNPADFQNGNILLTGEAYQNGKLIAQQQINLTIYNKPLFENDKVQIQNTEGAYIGTITGVTEIFGLTGHGLYFKGLDSFLAIPDRNDLALINEGTIEAWINPENFKAYAGIIHKGEKVDFSDEAYSLQFWEKNKQIALVLTNEKGDKIELVVEKIIENGVWTHVAATWDQKTIKLFVNGQKVMEKQNGIGPLKKSTGDLLIGSRTKEQYNHRYKLFGFNGVIDGLGIYTKALPENIILDHYNFFKK